MRPLLPTGVTLGRGRVEDHEAAIALSDRVESAVRDHSVEKSCTTDKHVVVIGGGPAGLTAAYELAKYGLRPTVLEKGNMVGGLARTENYKGFHFDMGGHRFFTKSQEVKKMWHEVLQDDFLRRPRLSRIYFKKKFFPYPLKSLDTLKGLGLF